ncbi:MAG: glycosyltransferase family 2 protein [Deltaproteobacteria bacterium]|nr:glycosyltransferase family 2 protein [Deltaproteobacteria bacterium]MBW2659142.1 glycosyltransferase family 2 protein [Deltaproteobacteria bacterium]
MKSVIIVIPAYQPDSELLLVLEQLEQRCVSKVLVVNDGSDPFHDPLFSRAAEYPQVKVLCHPENMGKGAALRTGFKFVMDREPTAANVVTADADGQHRPEDICRVSAACENNPDSLILGAREFNGCVPLRSRLGNSLTRWLYNTLFQQNLSDTQTGLRGIPVNVLASLLTLTSGRYSYELEMLLLLNQQQLPIVEIPISTVYENNNSSSHFRPLRDSLQIYLTLFRWWRKRV